VLSHGPDRLQAGQILEALIAECGAQRLLQLLAEIAQGECDACLQKRDQITAAKWAHSIHVLKRAAGQIRC